LPVNLISSSKSWSSVGKTVLYKIHAYMKVWTPWNRGLLYFSVKRKNYEDLAREVLINTHLYFSEIAILTHIAIV